MENRQAAADNAKQEHMKISRKYQCNTPDKALTASSTSKPFNEGAARRWCYKLLLNKGLMKLYCVLCVCKAFEMQKKHSWFVDWELILKYFRTRSCEVLILNG
jgi:hypothetical protein